jgi:hypothetical protein
MKYVQDASKEQVARRTRGNIAKWVNFNVIFIGLNQSQFEEYVRWLLVTAHVVRSSPILVTLMMEALGSSETSILTRATQRNIL